jgi:hypothetical protein
MLNYGGVTRLLLVSSYQRLRGIGLKIQNFSSSLLIANKQTLNTNLWSRIRIPHSKTCSKMEEYLLKQCVGLYYISIPY